MKETLLLMHTTQKVQAHLIAGPCEKKVSQKTAFRVNHTTMLSERNEDFKQQVYLFSRAGTLATNGLSPH